MPSSCPPYPIRILITVLICFILLTGPPQAFPNHEENYDDEWLRNYTQDKNQQNFADWAGIIFFCNSGKKDPEQTLDEICEKSFTNASSLAASAKIPLGRAKDLQRVGFESFVAERLILMIDLIAATPPTAIGITLRAYTSYSGQVKRLDAREKRPKIKFNQRSGDLILWERGTIGVASNAQDLVGPVLEAIDQLLKQFFTDYLNAQQ